MGKRYGRNQKRRHREQIAQQLDTNLVLIQTNRSVIEQRNRLEDMIETWDREIRSILGEYSAFRAGTPGMFVQNVEAINRMMESQGPINYGVGGMPMNTQISYQYIVKFATMLGEIDPIDLRRYIRLKLSDGYGVANVALSRDLLLHRGLGPKDVQYLAEDLAKMLVEITNKNLKERQKTR